MTTVWVLITLTMAYPVLRGLQLRQTELLRLQFAEKGKALLSSPKFDEKQKELFTSMLDDAFEWRFMAFASFLLPSVALRYALDSNFRARIHSEDVTFCGIEKQAEGKEFMRLHREVVIAANPIFFVVVFLEIIFILVPSIIIAGSVDAGVDRFKQTVRATERKVSARVGHKLLHGNFNHA